MIIILTMACRHKINYFISCIFICTMTKVMKKIKIPESIKIEGGHTLRDGASVKISGAKNEILGAMCAAILTDKPVKFTNVPHITDVIDLIDIMQDIGIRTQYQPNKKTLDIHAQRITSNELNESALKFRASYYIWGALLGRFTKTGEFNSLKIKVPGGCAGFGTNGTRPFDFHINLLENVFGATLHDTGKNLEFVLPKSFDAGVEPIYSTTRVSHGATFHWMLSVALSPNLKMIFNSSLEPEVSHLLSILNKMGANIRGTNSEAMTNLGHTKYLLNGGQFEIMPDRLETGFYAQLALATKSKIKLIGTDAPSCRPWLNTMIEIAGKSKCKIGRKSMEFDFQNLHTFTGRNMIISPIPGKETDMHQTWAPVLSMATSQSKIYDPIYENRTRHLPELAKFGLNSSSRVLDIKNSVAPKSSEIIINPSILRPAVANGMDLRGTAALIIAATMANGESTLYDIGYALRGYPNLIQNLKNIGIHIR